MTDYPYPDTTLLIFARAPIPGACKTRLIPDLGEEGAAALQAELIERTVHALCNTPLCETQLWCQPDTSHPCFHSLADRYTLSLHTQQGTDLGGKMHHALSQQTTRYSILVGTDIPLLSQAYVIQAITALQHGNEAVIGPAEDGGYVLLGLQKPDAGLFQGVDWGSAHVLQQTCERMSARRLVWQALAPLWDLDDRIGLQRYARVKATSD